MRIHFPGQPTAQEIADLLTDFLDGKTLTSAQIRDRGISPGLAIHTLRHKLGVPIATIEVIEPTTKDYGEDVPSYSEHVEGHAADETGVKSCAYYLRPEEIARYRAERSAQMDDYKELLRRHRVRSQASSAASLLRRRGHSVPDDIHALAALKFPGTTEGISLWRDAANDAEFAELEAVKKTATTGGNGQSPYFEAFGDKRPDVKKKG